MFRFSIRDVLWLTVVVALCIAWGVDHYRVKAENQRLTEYAEECSRINKELKLLSATLNEDLRRSMQRTIDKMLAAQAAMVEAHKEAASAKLSAAHEPLGRPPSTNGPAPDLPVGVNPLGPK